jgi:hypothetical protein
MTENWFECQWKRIEVALAKYERDPSLTNKIIVECMILDYEAKQNLVDDPDSFGFRSYPSNRRTFPVR